MFIHFDAERPSDPPFIERVRRRHSESGGSFISVASSRWEMVVTRLAGGTTFTLRGPETRSREVYCPPQGEWFAIRFKSGSFMPQFTLAEGAAAAHCPVMRTRGTFGARENSPASLRQKM